MKIRLLKLSILTFSVAFAMIVITTFSAERLAAFSVRPVLGAMPEMDDRLKTLELAIKLDPINAELRFKKFLLLQAKRSAEGRKRPDKNELTAIREAMDLRPLWPKYHLYYGLVLDKMSSNPNIVTRDLILSQLKTASELKPYSRVYKAKYEEYLKKFASQ